MDSICFKAAFGDVDCDVVLSPIADGWYFHIYIDRRYYGGINKYDIGWTVMSQKMGDFSTYDRDAILERLLEAGYISEPINWSWKNKPVNF